MASLFKSVKADVKRKRVFLLSAELCDKIDGVEKRAERHGISFPINEHVIAAIQRLVSMAEKELCEMESHNDDHKLSNASFNDE